ncbi:MAG TPA: ester cyclase [Kofleriaceae bacterium]|nr:ester cyclase [Kofleriaceae bacterium]
MPRIHCLLGHLIGVTACIAILIGCHEPATPSETTSPTTAPMISSDHNKRVVQRLFEEALNHKHPELFAELVSADYVGPTGERGPAAFGAVVGALWTAFPDIQYQLDAVVAEADRVAVRWTWTGTHSGPFRGLAPSHKAVRSSGMAIFELHAGKITQQWMETDRLGFLQAIGMVPADLGSPPAPRR